MNTNLTSIPSTFMSIPIRHCPQLITLKQNKNYFPYKKKSLASSQSKHRYNDNFSAAALKSRIKKRDETFLFSE